MFTLCLTEPLDSLLWPLCVFLYYFSPLVVVTCCVCFVRVCVFWFVGVSGWLVVCLIVVCLCELGVAVSIGNVRTAWL